LSKPFTELKIEEPEQGTCPICSKTMPLSNLELHQIHCARLMRERPQPVENDKPKKDKMKKQKKAHQRISKNTKDPALEKDYDDDDANAYPEPNDTQDSTSNPEFLGGQNTYKSAENEICDHFSRQAEVRRSNTALQQPSQTTTGAVNMVAPRITIVNDKDSMKQIIRVFVKKHLFRKLKFWKKADDGGYSSDPKTPAGLFFRTIQIPTLMNAEDKATLWASYVPLVGQLHTDHRNNCIKDNISFGLICSSTFNKHILSMHLDT